jgi:hypothetical protein
MGLLHRTKIACSRTDFQDTGFPSVQSAAFATSSPTDLF